MGLYKDLCTKELESPDFEIGVLDKKFILKNNLEVRIEKVTLEDKSFYFVVESQKGEIYFKTRDKFFGRELLTLYDEPLINVCGCTSNKIKRRIYAGNSENYLLGEIKKKDSFRGKKYLVEFNRIGIGRKDYFVMTCDKDMRICTISYGHENGNKRFIGKAVRSLVNKCLYEIEIVSGVDIVFILGLFMFFVEVTHLTKRKGFVGGLGDNESD
ncbi:hypothetical protein PIROE2DRAFT_11449 [Piromyces sp. E2]|nr:hypothetical protein PIROE2DRAFT_11449 [Piromyces sp. E2]|eukprot:OUM62299.1 hypothetical protein PIROE2DRAFT_11449 [Piromyces sp. E2]